MSFYSPRTATSLIIANMVGVGVFTSLGLQLQNTTDGFLLLLMWFLGGLAALTGAMSYAELGGSFPRSGGEYNFLGRIYHPSAGFVSGWISMTIGFAAPIALIAMAFADIVIDVTGLKAGWAMPIAAGLVIICTWFHIQNHRQSSWFQDSFTFLKILLILIFCAAALILAPAPQPVDIIPEAQDLSEIFTSPFAVSLVYVAFAYTGWNAATYILDELEHPQKDLPRILIFGTVLVTVIYVLLNFVFLKVAPVEAMAGQKQVGSIAASYAFGENGGKIFSIMFALLFISSVGAMTLAGPRAVQAIGEDYRLFSFLGAKNKAGLPMRAILLQSIIAIALILTSTFETLMTFAGAMLALNSAFAILGVIILRFKEPGLTRPYKVPLFPLVPMVYLTITGFFLYFVIKDRPYIALVGLGIILAGFALYGLSRAFEKEASDDTV